MTTNGLPSNGYGSDSSNYPGGLNTYPSTQEARMDSRHLEGHTGQPELNQSAPIPAPDHATPSLHSREVRRSVDPVINHADTDSSDQTSHDAAQLQQPLPVPQRAISTDDLTAQPIPPVDNKSSSDNSVVDANKTAEEPQPQRQAQTPTSSAIDSQPSDNEALKNLSDQELLKKGDETLESAKEAYTKYARNKLAHDAKEALIPFIECANNAKSHFPIAGADWFKNSENLLASLKEIKLPLGVSEDLVITIQYPDRFNKQVFPLIPPGDALKSMNPTQVYECYILAFGAMSKKVAEFNNGNDKTLEQAKAMLEDLTAALAAHRKEIDRRQLKNKEGPHKPEGSQLEMDFHRFTEQGVAFSEIAEDEHFAYFEAQSKAPALAKKSSEDTQPASADDVTVRGRDTPPVQDDTAVSTPDLTAPQSNSSAPAATNTLPAIAPPTTPVDQTA